MTATLERLPSQRVSISFSFEVAGAGPLWRALDAAVREGGL